MKRLMIAAAFSLPSMLLSTPSLANGKIEGSCLRWFLTNNSGMKAKDYMPMCKCAAAELDVAGMSGAERRQLEQNYDNDLMYKIFNRKPGSIQRADACLDAQLGRRN